MIDIVSPYLRVVILVGLILLPSCSKKHEYDTSCQSSGIDTFREQEAKLIDIPIPFGSKPLKRFIESMQESEQIMLGYETEMSIDALHHFYVQEMERLGWQQKGVCRGPEQFLLFNRPGKISMVSIRPHTHGATEFIICAQLLKS